jgi:hypothetical protein
MKKYLLLLLVILSFVSLSSLDSCTVISAAEGDVILGGTNKDWHNIATRIKVIPTSEGKYGRIYFGYQVSQGFQNVGGINEHGLWYDGASLPERYDVANYYHKPTIQGELCEKALEECAIVQEVIDLYSTYYTPHWDGHSMWGDSLGNSVIIEFGERDVIFVNRQGNHQVMTNFYVSDSTDYRWYNSYRFKVASYLFENASSISQILFKTILDETHQHGVDPTVFSNIYDLKNREIYIYNFHNFSEVVKLNVDEELQKGENYYNLPELFHQVHLDSPINAQAIFSQSIELKWYGNAANYQVYYSDDPDLLTSEHAVLKDKNWNNQLSYLFGSMSIGFMFVGSICFRKKRNRILLLVILLLTSFSACSLDIITSPYHTSEILHSTTVNDLQPNTVYYWKVIAIGDEGINSESEIQVFVTGDF